MLSPNVSTNRQELLSTRALTRGQRALAMAEKYQAGSTLQEIGTYYGITRERVRQLMTMELGVTAKDGGKHVRGAAKKKAATARIDLNCIRRNGMSIGEYRQINSVRDSRGRSPRHRFTEQRNNAVRRDLNWNLTFGEWWNIWNASGRWDERGRGTGYVMARHGDKGSYAIGNVKIIAGTENQSEFIRRYWSEVRSGKRPKPQAHGAKKTAAYHFLTPGQSVSVARANPRAFTTNAYMVAKQNGWKFKTRIRDGVVTITRLS